MQNNSPSNPSGESQPVPSGPDGRFDAPLLSDEEIAAAAGLDDRLRAGTQDSDDHAAPPNLAVEFADAVRLLRDVLGKHPNEAMVNRETTSTADDGFRLRAIDSAAQTLPLDGSDPGSDASFQTVRLAAVVEDLPQRFTILGELGRGSYGIVYRAHDTSLKRDVAIKILRPELMTDDNLRRRFLQESQAAARLNHPCIVRVFEAQETTHVTWQVSEFVEGTTLSQHLTGQPMSERIAARLLRDLSDAVQHAHSNSVVHRDIKPDNVLIDRMPGEPLDSATPRLTDFGLARIMDHAMRMSHSGILVGTPRYMAPEQLTGSISQHGPATDIYSLGVLLYEMLAGCGPFQGIDSLAQRVATVQSPVPSVRQKQSSVSRDLATICSRCLEFRPDDRYASAAELRDDLQRFLDGRPTLARPLSSMESLWRWARRNPAVAALSALTVAILVFSLGLTLRSNVAFKEQNDQLVKVNTELKAEQQRTQELNTLAEESRQHAEAGERRFQKLAWNAGIRQAYSAWEHHVVPEAMHLLDELKATDAQAESRIEWQLLHQDVSRFCRRLLTIDAPIHELRLIPDSPLVVAAAGDGKLYVVNFITGKLTRTITTTAPSLNSLAISDDGKLLATGGTTDPDTDLSYPEVYNVSTGDLVCKLPGLPTTIESLEFSADGNWLACGARYEKLRFVHLETSEVIEVPASRRHTWLTRRNQPPQFLAQSFESACWISSGTSPFAGKESRLPFFFDRALAVPDTNLMLCSLVEGVNIQLIDTTGTNVLCGFTAGVQNVEAMHLTNDLSLLTAGLANGELVCWRFPESLDDVDYRSAISELAASSRAMTLNSGNLRNWPSVPTFYEAVRWNLFECPVTSVAATDDRILVSSHDGSLISLQRWLPESQLPNLNVAEDNLATRLRSLAWNPDGNVFVAGLCGGTVHINSFIDSPTVDQDIKTYQIGDEGLAATVHTIPFDSDTDDVTTLTLRTGSARAVAFSPNGRIFVINHYRKGLDVHSIDGEMNILSRWALGKADEPDAFTSEIRFSSDSQRIAWTGMDNQLHIGPISLKSEEILNIDLKGYGQCLAWSPDDRFVFVGGRFDDVLEVEVASGTQRSLLKQAARPVAMIFDPHRSQLVTGQTDGTLRFIDPATCAVTQELQFHDVNIQSIALSRDGRIGISADTGGNLAVWFAETGERIGKLASMSSRPLEVAPVKPALVFTENDAAFRLIYATYDNKLATRSWRFK